MVQWSCIFAAFVWLISLQCALCQYQNCSHITPTESVDGTISEYGTVCYQVVGLKSGYQAQISITSSELYVSLSQQYGSDTYYYSTDGQSCETDGSSSYSCSVLAAIKTSEPDTSDTMFLIITSSFGDSSFTLKVTWLPPPWIAVFIVIPLILIWLAAGIFVSKRTNTWLWKPFNSETRVVQHSWMGLWLPFVFLLFTIALWVNGAVQLQFAYAVGVGLLCAGAGVSIIILCFAGHTTFLAEKTETEMTLKIIKRYLFFFPRTRIIDLYTVLRFDLAITGYGKSGPLYSLCYYTKENPTKLESLEIGSSNVNIMGRRQLADTLNRMIGYQDPVVAVTPFAFGANPYAQAVTINVLQQQLDAQTQALANATAALNAQQQQQQMWQQQQPAPPPYGQPLPPSYAPQSPLPVAQAIPIIINPAPSASSGGTKRPHDTPVRGYLVESVMDGSAAQEAGLRERDIVMEVNGKPATVDVITELVKTLSHSSSGGPQPDGGPFTSSPSTPDVASVLMLVLDQTTDEQRLVRLVPKPGGSLGLRWSPFGWASEFA